MDDETNYYESLFWLHIENQNINKETSLIIVSHCTKYYSYIFAMLAEKIFYSIWIIRIGYQ